MLKYTYLLAFIFTYSLYAQDSKTEFKQLQKIEQDIKELKENDQNHTYQNAKILEAIKKQNDSLNRALAKQKALTEENAKLLGEIQATAEQNSLAVIQLNESIRKSNLELSVLKRNLLISGIIIICVSLLVLIIILSTLKARVNRIDHNFSDYLMKNEDTMDELKIKMLKKVDKTRESLNKEIGKTQKLVGRKNDKKRKKK
jgi:DNA repair exonuclease SbcCD ATPase subunit